MREDFISAEIVSHLADCIALSGRNAEKLLLEFGIPPKVTSDRNAVIPLADYVALFERAASAVGNQQFGLRAAKMVSAESLGPLGFLFLSAPTLLAAFKSFAEYLGKLQTGTVNEFRMVEGGGEFVYFIQDDRISPRRQDSEYSIAAMCNLARQYLGPEFTPTEVHFEHEMVGEYRIYEDYFECPVFFAQAANQLQIDDKFLKSGSAGFSDHLFPIISGHLQSMRVDADEHGSLSQEIDAKLIPENLENPLGLAAMAKLLNRSPATLNRHLRREGLTYGKIFLTKRMAMADRLLTGSRRAVSDIALSVGYSENASFTRAFIKFHGITPSARRKAAFQSNRIRE